jgi:quercetin dioxygenase-like cupin family protein
VLRKALKSHVQAIDSGVSNSSLLQTSEFVKTHHHCLLLLLRRIHLRPVCLSGRLLVSDSSDIRKMGSVQDEANPKAPFPDTMVHVTGHSLTGKSVVQSSTVEAPKSYDGKRVSHSLLYSTAEFPADLNNDKDVRLHGELKASGKLNIVNPGGTIIRIVNFAPRHFSMMHRTQSLDYGMVLEGEVIMELDDGSKTLMRKGDLAVQRATMHTWINNSDTEWARMLFVLQDCKPLTVAGQRLKEDLGEVGYSVFPKSGNDEEG